MDVLQSPGVAPVGIALLLVIAGTLARRHYQRCPHCRRIVPRAHRGWRRCRTCGRQYHRSVQLRR